MFGCVCISVRVCVRIVEGKRNNSKNKAQRGQRQKETEREERGPRGREGGRERDG